MLLKHAWLKPLSKPQTITEEAEEGDAAAEVAEAVGKIDLGSGTEDDEVAAWAQAALARLASGEVGADDTRPALHAAPLDSVSPLGNPAS
jgi:mitogen-activated protein kinase kinase